MIVGVLFGENIWNMFGTRRLIFCFTVVNGLLVILALFNLVFGDFGGVKIEDSINSLFFATDLF